MTHEWKDFHPDNGPLLPLGSGQQVQLVSGVMPSGEGHFFDHRQNRTVYTGGSGINYPFPHPHNGTPDREAFLSQEDPSAFPDQFSKDWWDANGVVKTYPEDSGTPFVSGSIFNASGLESPFSNSQEAQLREIEQFTIFNDYIHHHRLDSRLPPIKIPYISEYFTSSMKSIESFSSKTK